MKINKYGVPLDSTSDRRGALIQPKFTNRFRVLIQNMGDKDKGVVAEQVSTNTLDINNAVNNTASNTIANNNNFNHSESYSEILAAQVESFERPTITFENKEVFSFLGKGHVPGRGKISNTILTIRDDITNAVMAYIMGQADLQTARMFPTQGTADGFNPSQFLGISPKFTMVVEVMDGRSNHTALETWLFDGCTIESIKPSVLSYESEDISTYTIDIALDHMQVLQNQKILFADYDHDDTTVASSQSAFDIVDQFERGLERFQDFASETFSNVNDFVDDLNGN